MALLPVSVALVVLVAALLLGQRLRGAEWLAAALVASRLALAVALIVVVADCVGAATGHGRVGSASVAIGTGQKGTVVLTHFDGERAEDDIAEAGDRSAAERVRRAREALVALAGPDAGGPAGKPARVQDAALLAPIPDPSPAKTLIALVAAAVSLVPLLGGLLTVEGLLRRARAGDVFSPMSVRALRRLALLVGVGTYVAALVDLLAAEALAGGRFDGLHARLEAGFLPLGVGLLLLALAEVWRSGLALREDVAATV